MQRRASALKTLYVWWLGGYGLGGCGLGGKWVATIIIIGPSAGACAGWSTHHQYIVSKRCASAQTPSFNGGWVDVGGEVQYTHSYLFVSCQSHQVSEEKK